MIKTPNNEWASGLLTGVAVTLIGTLTAILIVLMAAGCEEPPLDYNRLPDRTICEMSTDCFTKCSLKNFPEGCAEMCAELPEGELAGRVSYACRIFGDEDPRCIELLDECETP
jgi:hypothetical protein